MSDIDLSKVRRCSRCSAWAVLINEMCFRCQLRSVDWEQVGRDIAAEARRPTVEGLVELLAQVQVTDRCCCGTRAHAGHPCTLGAEGAERVVAALTEAGQ